MLKRLTGLALVDAINNWIEYKVYTRQDYGVIELLACRHLVNLKHRLARKLLQLDRKPGIPQPFRFTLSEEEIFSVLTCLKPHDQQFLLLQVYGEVQQVSLNYPHIQLKLCA